VIGVTGALAAVAFATPVHAQYFGQNKVQYEDFDFEVLKTEHFDIYYYPEEDAALDYVALMAERWYARLSRLLNHDLSSRQPLVVYASGPHFRQTNTLQGDIGESTGGVTEILKRRIVLPVSGPLAETDHVIGHELVHAFQFDITGEGGGIAMAGIPSVMRFPLWFVEGMAEYLSIGPNDPNTAMWMRAAVKQDELPDARKLQDPRFFPYRYGQALWAYIAGRWGDDAVGRILKASRTSPSPAVAFTRVLRMTPDSVVAGWHQALKDYYTPLVERTADPTDYGRPLVTHESQGGRLNIAPELSPDGQRIVFMSERDLFSIDIYLADVRSGNLVRRVTNTAVSPHFESLQFINSAGAWSADGAQFAFGAITKGRPVLTVVNPETGDVIEEISLPELGEIYNPTWSPDGRFVAFSGLSGGLTDLYVYDLQERSLRRLTNDAYADLHPAWSPDGTTIAFATDRFSTGLSSLLYGNYAIGLLTVANGAIREGPGFERGKSTNPRWSPDGRSLFFISDRNGISNVYRSDLATGTMYQVTNLYTGVSGIASLSPALSVAGRAGTIAFSTYQKDVNSIYVIETPETIAGGPIQERFADLDPAVLPPATRMTDDVTNLLANAFYGLPTDTSGYGRGAYRPRLALDYIGQPSLAVGVDPYGTYIAGGASFFFSDMLGGHNVATALGFHGRVQDVSALLGYTNLSRRLNWALVGQMVPYIYGYSGYQFGTYLGRPAIAEQQIIYRQYNRSVAALAAYPFSRAQRVELSAGFLNVGFSQELRTLYWDYTTGQLLDQTRQDLGAPSALNLAQANVALVYDNSLWGVASPLLGQRYRLDVGANVGTLDFVTGLADFRKYVMPIRPFTLAARLMHYGRYGPDGESDRLQDLFIGYDGLVRGYEYGSMANDYQRCASQAACDQVQQTFETLFGSKMLVGNIELRFPPLGLLGIGNGLFGFLPLEAVVFGDAGLAWWDNEHDDPTSPRYTIGPDKPFFLGGDRKPVYSAGAGLRLNVFGYLIIEGDWVVPFSRDRGGYFQFSFAPGF
jgi:hypothetical protein